MCGNTEHSTVTSWGRENEFKFYDNYIESNKGAPIIACVMDSYDIFKAVEYITTGERRAKIESEDYPIFVIRPDSGDPVGIVQAILKMLITNVDHTITEGLMEFAKYRVIYGDGITPMAIEDILRTCKQMGVSPDMLSFGSGGDLIQNLNRDTLGFAIKCSSVTLHDGTKHDVYKDPIHGHKKSKKGEVITVTDGYGYMTGVINKEPQGFYNMLNTRFLNGQAVNQTTFEEVRKCIQ